MASTSISLLFIPGMSSIADIVYAPLLDHLTKQHSFDASQLHTINLPSIDVLTSLDPPTLNAAHPLLPSALHADIAHIRSAITTEFSKGNNVILIAHSYGGSPTLAASKGLWKHLSPSSPGILRILLISSAVPHPNTSTASTRIQYKADHPEVQFSDDAAGGDVIVLNESVPVLIPKPFLVEEWFAGVTDPEIRGSLKPSNLTNALTPLQPEEVNPSEWKLDYLVTTGGEDLAMPEVHQEYLVDRARQAGADVEIQKVQSGHFVFCTESGVKETGAWVVEGVKKGMKGI